MFALRDGNQELVDALAASLDGALRTSTPALTLQRGVRWHVGTPHDEVVAERAWLACPLPVAARLLDAPDLTVPTAPIASISLVYRREEVPSGQRGFGWLAPSAERRDVLGCLWVSDVFPGHAPGRALLRVMVGGARAPELVGLGEERLADHARRVLHEVQGLDAEPVLVDVATYPDGIPQYPLGHAAAVASWQDRWPGLRLVGWGVTGIGVSHTTRATAELARR